jgi:hypothetical protein
MLYWLASSSRVRFPTPPVKGARHDASPQRLRRLARCLEQGPRGLPTTRRTLFAIKYTLLRAGGPTGSDHMKGSIERLPSYHNRGNFD